MYTQFKLNQLNHAKPQAWKQIKHFACRNVLFL